MCVHDMGYAIYSVSLALLHHIHTSIHTHTPNVTDMANIFALLLICMYIFAILGYSFFGENCPKHFGSLGTCRLYIIIKTFCYRHQN